MNSNSGSESIIKVFKQISFVVVLVFLSACSSGKKAMTLEQFNERSKASVQQEINDQIRSAAVFDGSDTSDKLYRLGTGDLVEVTVFRAEKFNTTARINGNGDLFLPLVGMINVSERTISEAESILVGLLAKDYINNPQVSIFVKEYRSQEITVMGAVSNPNVYNVKRSRSVVEMLSLAGGVSGDAADTIRVSTQAKQEGSSSLVKKNYVLSINGLLNDREALSNIRLNGGDAIFVPEAGVVYVEGAVNKPGAYKMTGDVSVLQALSLAGGAKWESNQSRVRVVRELQGTASAVEVDINGVRNQKTEDLILEDGDIVIVEHGVVKTLFSSFLKGVRSIVGFGYTLN